MSRNVDKANSVLVRFQELEAEKSGGYKDYSRFKRPTRIRSIQDSQEAQQWRRQVLQDMNSRITRMHDPSLNEIQLREINDEINDLLHEKNQWERHIYHNLKGPNFSRDSKAGVTGTLLKGRRYFGRALELPEVRELLKQDREHRTKLQTNRQRHQVLQDKVRKWKKQLGPAYYGFSSDIPGLQFQLPEATSNTDPEVLHQKPTRYSTFIDHEEAKTLELRSELGSLEAVSAPKVSIPEFKELPDLKDMENWLVEKRKLQLQKQLDL
ncbi:LADA_0H04676g1_1 [Lachancea dasiensis]|uniref:Pre-mRNA-splicing factor ISY1 n=1 Tax=Lachancea dasiensis TaxID=1072105 RepID=A0A1G4K0V8_9SACH|nr:LADA_0H04676g1_1 [Lachancea dasiensis]